MRVLNILVRRYLALDEIDAAVAFYEELIGQKRRLEFDYPEYDLKLSQVASILFIAGTDKSLAPFRATEATFLVKDLDAFAAHLPKTGSIIVEAAKPVPTGRNMLVRHPDGMLVEYVEHANKHPADVAALAG